MKTIRKALFAGGFALVAAVGVAMLDGNLTGGEAIASVGAGLVAGAGTYQIRNARPAS